MDIEISHSSILNNQKLVISGSKSETNRLVLLQALYKNIEILNASNSDDASVMLKAIQSNSDVINIHHAGTAMRFLTAFFATQQGKTTLLSGSERMKERPIQILVEALNQLGANIEYLEKPGYPPIKIIGSKITKNKISISANISSQYISALILIAPKLENGLEITLTGTITSRPYIEMTLSLLNQIGVETNFTNNKIKIKEKKQTNNIKINVESDWSSASYYYSIIALSELNTKISLSNFKENSLQADREIAEIYTNFGVKTYFESNNSITLKKEKIHSSNDITLNLISCPDIAQTVAVTCFGLGIKCTLTGLHTLKIKETDRISALKNELEKFGAIIFTSDEHIDILTHNLNFSELSPISISTYQDHRMAMAFAPLALKTKLIISEAEVVNKSYPNFWADLKNIGFKISE